MNKTFSIYRSSAGSGKTRTLAKEYLKLALSHRASYFRHVLAVTFTNKSTQEMKERILSYLDEFAKGEANELAEELRSELNLDAVTFQERSQELQRVVLHTYSQFSISTIDAFFQKVIRSFTRESGLMGDYRLEVEQDLVLEEVIDDLIDELGSNKELTDWVVEFANDNLENERSWDVRQNLREFAEQIFKEEFKEIEDDLIKLTEQKDFSKNLMSQLRESKWSFMNYVKSKASQGFTIITNHGFDETDFKYSGGAGYKFFKKFNGFKKVSDFEEPGVQVTRDLMRIENWPRKESSRYKEIIQLADSELLPLMKEILDYREAHFRKALSVEIVLERFYAFGLLADISRKLKEYKQQNNVMLLADAPKFLNGVIQDSDTPFIYEKIGSFYRNYLIDEFQDTSGYQWKNFLPLLTNSLDQGYRSVLVGDVKQAIYRWRGGDLALLQQKVESQIGKDRVDVNELDTNYRSAPSIVNFNNLFFKSASALVSTKVEGGLPTEVFNDVAQHAFKKGEGLVQIDFIKEEEKENNWKEVAMDGIPIHLEKLQKAGVRLSDIAILVRKNDEGQKIAAHLLRYKNSESAQSDCRYDVISNESLQVDGASSVNVLLGAMRYLHNPEDAIARAQLAYEFARIKEPKRELAEVFAVGNQATFESNLPLAFSKYKSSLKKLVLFELTETLIEIFKLGTVEGELAYLQAFQDIILEFYSRERNDLGAFLEWWDENGYKKSVQVSGEVDAVQIVTIHKSKGLQFKYVLIPFCSWNMDHDNFKTPMLWVNSDKSPFKDAGHLPVQYSSKLKESYFSEFYENEIVRCYLDNLNLLYVAFTRAEQGLIVTAPFSEKNQRGFSVARLMQDAIVSNIELQAQWNQNALQWKIGEITPSPSTKKTETPPLSLQVYQTSRWRDRLIIKRSPSSFFEKVDEDQLAKVQYGLRVHAVLSRIRYADEVTDTLNAIIAEGLITTHEKEDVQKQLNELLAQPQIADWFSNKWNVRTEVPILVPGADESRIDRLMTSNKKAIVVDFKTGERNRKDIHQVEEYMKILRQMNFAEVEGYVLYLRDGEVYDISKEGKQKIKKSKDESQLGLGF